MRIATADFDRNISTLPFYNELSWALSFSSAILYVRNREKLLGSRDSQLSGAEQWPQLW